MGSARDRRVLPGVQGRQTAAPVPVFNPDAEIRSARRKLNVADFIDLILLVVIDIAFMRWPDAHIPFISRDGSLVILLLFHVVVLAYWIRSRLVPMWRAKRIAATWSEKEREKVFREKG